MAPSATGLSKDRHRRRRAPHALLAAALVSWSCSFVAVRRPPPSPAALDAPLECTQSRVSPILDTVGAVAVPLMGLMVWGLCLYTSTFQSWSSNPSDMHCGGVIWAAALSTGTYAGSAVYGYQATSDCRRLAEQRRAGSPQPPTPPQSGP